MTLWQFGRTRVKSDNASVPGPVGNILWFIPGLFMAIAYVLSVALLCLAVIGIPFGMQAFKFTPLVLAPFGR